MLAVGPLGILVLHCRDRDHLAVITLAAQPAKKGAFEQLGVEPISLGAPMLARHRYTRCVNDVGLDAARLSQRANQKPSRPASKATAMRSILRPAFSASSPSMQQLQQCALVDRELLQRLALDARHDTGNEPARQAHLNDRNQRAVRLEGGRGIGSGRSTSAWGCSIGSHQRRWNAISSPLPHSIFHHGIRGRGGTIFWTTLPSV